MRSNPASAYIFPNYGAEEKHFLQFFPSDILPNFVEAIFVISLDFQFKDDLKYYHLYITLEKTIIKKIFNTEWRKNRCLDHLHGIFRVYILIKPKFHSHYIAHYTRHNHTATIALIFICLVGNYFCLFNLPQVLISNLWNGSSLITVTYYSIIHSWNTYRVRIVQSVSMVYTIALYKINSWDILYIENKYIYTGRNAIEQFADIER